MLRIVSLLLTDARRRPRLRRKIVAVVTALQSARSLSAFSQGRRNHVRIMLISWEARALFGASEAQDDAKRQRTVAKAGSLDLPLPSWKPTIQIHNKDGTVN